MKIQIAKIEEVHRDNDDDKNWITIADSASEFCEWLNDIDDDNDNLGGFTLNDNVLSNYWFRATGETE